jgi:TP901-1 family phage major tail protein
MAYRKGDEMLLKVDTDGLGTYVTVGGIQNPRLSIRRGEADVTNQQSPSKHRELLEAAGIMSMSVSGSGVFNDLAPAATIRQYAMNGTIRNWQLIVPGDGTYTGKFQVTQYERTGQHQREVDFSITLESAGVIAVS